MRAYEIILKAGLAGSSSQARAFIRQGALRINAVKFSGKETDELILNNGDIINIGRNSRQIKKEKVSINVSSYDVETFREEHFTIKI